MRRRRTKKNPGYVIGHSVVFPHGKRAYKYRKGVTAAAAARYLNRVKAAERAGRPIPMGPRGLGPSDAAALLGQHPYRKRRSKACPPCRLPAKPKPRKHAKRHAKPVRSPRPAAAARKAPKRATEFPDFWDDTFRTFGTAR